MSIDDMIERLRRYYRGMDEELLPGCDEAEAQRIKEAVQAKYGFDLPESYLAILRQVNGFGHDGYGLYASQPVWHPAYPDEEYPSEDGIIEANEGMEADGVAIPGGLAMGYGDDQVFGVDLTTGKYHQYDVYRKANRTFETFEDMFHHMFDPRIS